MKNATNFNHAANIFTQKWSKNASHLKLVSQIQRLKNRKFTASRTEIRDSKMGLLVQTTTFTTFVACQRSR